MIPTILEWKKGTQGRRALPELSHSLAGSITELFDPGNVFFPLLDPCFSAKPCVLARGRNLHL